MSIAQDVAQDVASIIANHVGRQLEEVEGAGMLSDADLKRMQDYYCDICNISLHKPDFSDSVRVINMYTLDGESLGMRYDEDKMSLVITSTKNTTRRVSTYTITIAIKVFGSTYSAKIFETKYTGSDPRAWVLGAFEQVYAAMHTIGKCSACEKYCTPIAKSYCPECYMNARVKRART
jgi:hypothetical protein